MSVIPSGARVESCRLGALGRGVEGPQWRVPFHIASGSSWNRLTGHQHFGSPMVCKILPAWIHLLDQCNLLLASPAFELFFTSDRLTDIVKAFVEDESDASACLRKPFNLSRFVLKNTKAKLPCNTDVQSAGEARHDVHPVLVFALVAHGNGIIAKLALNRGD